MNKNVILYGFSAIALCLVSFGVGVITTDRPVPTLENGKEVVATIKGKEFTAEELYDEMVKANGTSTLVNAVDNFIASKEIEVTDKITQAAKNQVSMYKTSVSSQGGDWQKQLADWGFKNEQEMEDFFVKEEKKNEVINNYLKGKLTDKQIKDYYDKEVFGELTARHILIKPKSTDSDTDDQKAKAKEQAKEKAIEVIEKLKNGEKWEDLVKKYSEDEGTKEKNGELSFKKGEVVEPFFKATLNLELNKFTLEPVESEFGYHIIFKVKEDAKPKLEDEKENIKESLVTIELEKENVFDKTWVEIRKSYDLKIFDNVIKDLYTTISSQFK